MITEEFLEELDRRCGASPEHIVPFTPEELQSFSPEDVAAVIEHFHGQALMMLPQSDIDFFEWVKANDLPVWTELWGGDAPVYTVSIAFLRSYTGDAFGFSICDLIDSPNYYFHKEFIVDIEKENLIGDILKRIRESVPLSMANVFILEIWLHPTDAWRFAYKYHYPLQEVKELAELLAEQHVLRHLKKREEIAEYIEW